MKNCSWLLLILFACSGTDKKDLPAVPMKGTYWKLNNMHGEKVKPASNDKAIHIIFMDEDNSITGFAGCNRIIGNYVLNEPDKISMLAASTKMMCVDNMEIEDAFLKILTEADSYNLQGQQLEFMINAEVVAVFESVEPD